MTSTTEFVSEKDLAESVADSVCYSVARADSSARRVVVRELDCNGGRADVVCAVFHKDDVDARGAELLGAALSQPTKAVILSLLHRSSPHTQGYIQKTMGLGEKTVQKHLRDLIEMGVVERTATGSLRLGQSYSLPDVEIWSFEVKLYHWKRALYQASRYRSFSHNAVVVMPSERLRVPKNNLEMFKAMNVGLAGVDNNGTFRFVSRPKKRRPKSRGLYLGGLGQVLSEYSRLHSEAASEV